MQHDFNGTLCDSFENYEPWNPAAYTGNWSTPHPIVHNELDYRLPIEEGVSASMSCKREVFRVNS